MTETRAGNLVPGRKMIAILFAVVVLAYAPITASAQEATTTADVIAATTTTAATTSVPAATDATTTAATTTSAASPAATTTAATSTVPAINTNVGVEAQVRAFFADTPIMVAIANCESGFREFNALGNPLNGGSGGMIGIFQISQSVHATLARSMGMDIYTVAGNMAYAKYLYQKAGTGPWLSSFACWNPGLSSNAQTSADTNPVLLHSNLVMGAVSQEVLALQQLLNKTSSPIAASGPGSPGQETQKFGALTRVAVRAFQCAQNIICTGDEYTTGYGAVGPATRTALLAVSGSAVATVPTPVNTTALPGAAEQAQIAQLEAQIAQLSQILANLIKQRAS